MDLGKRLLELRKEKSMGQKEVAAYLNVSTSMVSNYENNTCAVKAEVLQSYTKLFSVSSDYILGDTNYRYPVKTMDENLVEECTLSEFTNSIMELSDRSKGDMVAYANYLKSREQEEKDKKIQSKN